MGTSMTQSTLLSNYIGGRWTPATATGHFDFYTDKKVTISRWC